MNKLFILLSLFFSFYYGNLLPKYEYQATYSFVDIENISDKKMQETVEVIKNRINKFIRNVDVSINSNQELLVKIKADFNLERLNAVVLNQGKLDFWPCYTKDEVIHFVTEINKVKSNDTISDSLTTMIKGFSYDGFFNIAKKDTTNFRSYINKPEVKLLFTKEYKGLKFLFGMPNDELITVYAIKSNDKERASVNETHILDAIQGFDQINRPTISVTMDEFGAHNWSKITGEAYEKNSKIAITINDIVYSAPGVVSGPITGGLSQISGGFSIEEAQNLSYILGSQKSIPKLKFIKVSEIED